LGASGCNHLVGWPLLGFGVVAIGVGLKEIAEESNPLILCILPFPALFALFGAWFLFGKRETLRDPETGAMWQRHSLLGIETDHKIVADLEEIDLSLALPGPLDYPASISALGIETRVGTGWYRRNWITSGTDVLEATPIGMLAQDLIGVLYAITYRSDLYLPRRRRGKYMIVRGKSKEEPQSFLEKRILHVVETVRPYHSPRGISIYDLVYAVYQYDRNVPGRWLVYQVQDDAVAQGLGTTVGRKAKRTFVPHPTYAGDLEAQARALLALREQIERTHPSPLTAFQMNIRRAMQSRVPSD
jgi:hypothetical protein